MGASLAQVLAQGVTPRTTGVQPLTFQDIQQQRANTANLQAQAQERAALAQQEQMKAAQMDAEMQSQRGMQEYFKNLGASHSGGSAASVPDLNNMAADMMTQHPEILPMHATKTVQSLADAGKAAAELSEKDYKNQQDHADRMVGRITSAQEAYERGDSETGDQLAAAAINNAHGQDQASLTQLLGGGYDKDKFNTAKGMLLAGSAQIKAAKDQADIKATNATTAENVQKTATQARNIALQDLAGVNDPTLYAAWKARHPDVIAPAAYNPNWVTSAQKSAVPVEKQPEYEKGLLQNQLMAEFRANPQSGAQLIDRALPPQLDSTANAAAHAQFDAAAALGNTAGMEKAVADAASHASGMSPQKRAADVATDVAKETALGPVRTAQAVSQEKALGPLKIQQAIASEVGKQTQLMKMSPDAFGGIFDPRSRAAAQNTYEKDTKEYAEKIADAQRLQDYVHAAQSGNKAAPGLIGIAELRQLVNRVNSQELKSVGTGGDIGDKILGKINSWTEGQPIPPALLKDVDSLSQLTARTARRAYDYNIQVNNKTYGGKAQPIDLAPVASVSIPGGGMVKMKAPDGTIKPVPADQVAHYKSLGAQEVP